MRRFRERFVVFLAALALVVSGVVAVTASPVPVEAHGTNWRGVYAQRIGEQCTWRSANTNYWFDVTNKVGSGAEVIELNIGLVNAVSHGFAQAWRVGDPAPSGSALAWKPGDKTSNSIIVELDQYDRFYFRTSSSQTFCLDVTAAAGG